MSQRKLSALLMHARTAGARDYEDRRTEILSPADRAELDSPDELYWPPDDDLAYAALEALGTATIAAEARLPASFVGDHLDEWLSEFLAAYRAAHEVAR